MRVAFSLWRFQVKVLRPIHMEKNFGTDSSPDVRYAFKPIITADPYTGAKPDPQFADITWDSDPNATLPGLEPYVIQQAAVGNSGSAGQGRWGVCYTCREEFPIASMSIISGRTYCSEFGCAEEAKS